MIKGDDKRGADLVALVRDSLAAGLSVTKETAPVYVCFPWKTYTEFLTAMRDNGLEPDNCIVWRKNFIGLGNANYRPQHELVFYCARGTWYGDQAQSDVWDIKRDNTGDYVHPTQKPLRIVERALINSSRKGDIVLDLFGGSGTTLVACEKRGRKARLMELDQKYCDVIVRRWQKLTGGRAVHAISGEEFGD